MLISQATTAIVKDAASQKIDSLLSRTNDLEKRMTDSAFKTVDAQAKSEAAANDVAKQLGVIQTKVNTITTTIDNSATAALDSQARAEKSAVAAALKSKEAVEVLTSFENQLKASKDVLNAAENSASIAETLAKNPQFAQVVIKALADRFDFSVIRSPFQMQQVNLSCPTGSKLISASCVGNLGSLQAAVGPDFHEDGSISCYRYGPVIMPVQATAVCFSIK